MSADPAHAPASVQTGNSAVGDRSDPRARLRRQTLDCVGQVSVNAAPLLEVINAAPDDPDEVAAAIRWCPSLTARVLSVTNSAAFAGRRAIETVERAVIQLGASRARAIAMAFGLRLLNEPINLSPDLVRRLWVGSLRKAAAAELACEQIYPSRAGEAYCRALVQDLGLPMLMAVDPGFYEHEMLPGQRGEWAQQEAGRFGIDHAELGWRLLQSWSATDALSEAVRSHHQPPSDLEGAEAMLKLPVFLAGLLPHLDEELTGWQRDWLVTLHGQFLSERYASPDEYIQLACEQAENLVSGTVELDHNVLHGALAQAVADDSIEMVSQLCELEGALGRQREGIDKLRYQAFTDSLTKLLNRRGFMQLGRRRAEDAARRKLGVCCIAIDLDDLKPINDTLGHNAGDHMLRGLAKVLRRSLDRADLIARLGGDEFAVLVIDVDAQRANEITERLAKAQGTRLRITHEAQATLQFSIGAVHVERMTEAITLDELLAIADEAMYSRKHRGKGGRSLVSYEAATEHKSAQDPAE